MNEFEKIDAYFVKPFNSSCEEIAHSKAASASIDHLLLGIGDDCAEVNIPEGYSLLMSMDTVVEGVHFLPGSPANLIAERAVCVALSDLAAMGAKAKWITLALSVNETDTTDSQWWQLLSKGLQDAARRYEIKLIGGDTTKTPGPLTISVQVHGVAPVGTSLKRSGAKPGNKVFVSGSLGDGAAALAVLKSELDFESGDREYLLERFYRPEIYLDFAYDLRELATAAIDVSDGLLADLQHICRASHVGAYVDEDSLPLSKALSRVVDSDKAKEWALLGGDDYRLCFTLPRENEAALRELSRRYDIDCSCIGEVVALGENAKMSSSIDTTTYINAGDILSLRTHKIFPCDENGYKHF